MPFPESRGGGDLKKGGPPPGNGKRRGTPAGKICSDPGDQGESGVFLVGLL